VRQLQRRLVCDIGKPQHWTHFCLIVSVGVKMWPKEHNFVQLARELLANWAAAPNCSVVHERGDQNGESVLTLILFSNCVKRVLTDSASDILDASELTFDILFDLMRSRALADDLPRLARSNYLDALLLMQRLKNDHDDVGQRGVEGGSESIRKNASQEGEERVSQKGFFLVK